MAITALQVLSGILTLTLAAAAWAQAAPGDLPRHANGDLTITLEKALPGDKPLDIHARLRQGQVAAAFATAPTYNRALHDVALGPIQINDKGLALDLTVTLNPDGYVPKDGKPVNAKVQIMLTSKGDVLPGTYTATLGDNAPTHGKAQAVRVERLPENALLTLHLDNVLHDKDKAGKRAGLTISFQDGMMSAVRMNPPGSLVDISFATQVEEYDLGIKDGRLFGTVTTKVTPNDQPAQSVVCTLDVQLIAHAAGGTVKVAIDGKDKATGSVLGQFDTTTPPQPANALYTLTLHDGAGPGRPLVLHMVSRNGKITQGFAATPNFNNATHTLDASRLTLAGNRLSGFAKVTVNPDPWIPKDGKPFTATLDLNATLAGRDATGRYRGNFGSTDVRGALGGELTPRTPLKPTKATIKLENALTGGEPWHNRVFITVDLDPNTGKVISGKLSNNHSSLAGKVDAGTVTLKDDQFHADITATVAEGGNVTPGQYTFKVTGCSLGATNAGTFESHKDGKPLKTGSFWAAVSGTR